MAPGPQHGQWDRAPSEKDEISVQLHFVSLHPPGLPGGLRGGGCVAEFLSSNPLDLLLGRMRSRHAKTF